MPNIDRIKMELAKYLQRDDLNPTLQELYDMLGVELVAVLIQHFPGAVVYVPNAGRLNETSKAFIRAHPGLTRREYAYGLDISFLQVAQLLSAISDEDRSRT